MCENEYLGLGESDSGNHPIPVWKTVGGGMDGGENLGGEKADIAMMEGVIYIYIYTE